MAKYLLMDGIASNLRLHVSENVEELTEALEAGAIGDAVVRVLWTTGDQADLEPQVAWVRPRNLKWWSIAEKKDEDQAS